MDQVFGNGPSTPVDPVPEAAVLVGPAGRRSAPTSADSMSKRLARLELLTHVNQTILSTLDLDQLGRTVCRETRRLFPVDAFYFATYDPAARTIHFLFGEDDGLVDRGRSQPLDGGPTAHVIRTRRPYLVQTPDDPLHQAGLRFGDESKLTVSAIHVPLLLDGQAVGAISVQSYHLGTYDAADVELLVAVAEAAALALRNARLHRRAVEQWQRLRGLFEALDEGLALFDAAGRLLFSNHAARVIWGRPGSSGVGSDRGGDLVGGRVVEQALRSGQPASATIDYPRSEGTAGRARVSALPLLNQDAVEAVALVMRPVLVGRDVELRLTDEPAAALAADRPVVLIATTDRQFRRLVRSVLGDAGYRVVEASDAGDALRALETDLPELALVDAALSESVEPAFSRCQTDHRPLWVAIVADGGDETARVGYLEAGADDCWPKSTGTAELLARVRAILRRRARSGQERRPFANGDLRIDFERRHVSVGGREIRLTPTEYRLLTTLVGQAGRVLTSEQLLSLVWGTGYRDAPASIRAYIRRLRQKLGDDPDHPRFILTEYGVGYRFRVDR